MLETETEAEGSPTLVPWASQENLGGSPAPLAAIEVAIHIESARGGTYISLVGAKTMMIGELKNLKRKGGWQSKDSRRLKNK